MPYYPPPLPDDSISNAKLADMPPTTFKMRTTGTGNPIDGTAAEAKASLAITASDVSGLGGPYLPTAGGTMTGDLDLTKSGPRLNLKKAGGGDGSYLVGSAPGGNRWIMALGDPTPEAGGNAGSDFKLYSFSDTGVQLAVPISIERATGKVSLSSDPTAPLHAATMQYVDSRVGVSTASAVTFQPAGNIAAVNVQAAIQEVDTEKLAKAGDTMTGALTLAAGPTAPLHAATKQYVDANAGGLTDGDKGDITVGGAGASLTIDNDAVTNAKLANMAANTFKMAIAAGDPIDGTAAQAKTALAITAGDVSGLVGSYLPLTGGTLSGETTISKDTPAFNLNKTAATQDAIINGKCNGLHRWAIDVANGADESGGNAGSDFSIVRFNDAGVFLGQPLSISRATGLITMLGALTVTPKGSAFGGATGTVATGAIPDTDANIFLYHNSANSWAGIGADALGNLWFRTGTAGTPAATMYCDPDNWLILQKEPTLAKHAATKAYADLTALRLKAEQLKFMRHITNELRTLQALPALNEAEFNELYESMGG